MLSGFTLEIREQSHKIGQDTSQTEILDNTFPEKISKEKISLTQTVRNEESVRRLNCLA